MSDGSIRFYYVQAPVNSFFSREIYLLSGNYVRRSVYWVGQPYHFACI